jgi:predicted phage terminase large subunit-like protein
MWVVGLGEDENYYILDIVRDRLNLTERTAKLIALHKKYRPLKVGYEKYGMQADLEHIQSVMERDTYRFTITELGGQMAKNDRIRRLVPLFEQGKVWFPSSLHYTDYEKRTHDLVHVFREDEYKAFPVGQHDDLLDSLSRLCDEDMELKWPHKARNRPPLPEVAVI